MPKNINYSLIYNILFDILARSLIYSIIFNAGYHAHQSQFITIDLQNNLWTLTGLSLPTMLFFSAIIQIFIMLINNPSTKIGDTI